MSDGNFYKVMSLDEYNKGIVYNPHIKLCSNKIDVEHKEYDGFTILPDGNYLVKMR